MRLARLDMRIDGQTGVAITRRLAEASERYQRIVRATGMTLD
jgi:hypothetical protein